MFVASSTEICSKIKVKKCLVEGNPWVFTNLLSSKNSLHHLGWVVLWTVYNLRLTASFTSHSFLLVRTFGWHWLPTIYIRIELMSFSFSVSEVRLLLHFLQEDDGIFSWLNVCRAFGDDLGWQLWFPVPSRLSTYSRHALIIFGSGGGAPWITETHLILEFWFLWL